MFWFDIGMLLYLGKHLRPNIANADQELSKISDRVSKAVFFEMHDVIRFILDISRWERIVGHSLVYRQQVCK